MPLRLAVLLTGFLFSSVSNLDPVDEWAHKQMAENHIPGMLVAVYVGGKVEKIGTYGFADLEQHVPVRTDTIFEICSITKQFTATSILLLAQEGKLSIDDPITKFIPEVPGSWDRVTLRELMQHTSGLTDEVYDEQFPAMAFALEMKRLTAVASPDPNTAWSYSNMGYWLLAKVIEKVSGTPYYSFLQQRIFDPLGMRDTHPNVPTEVIERRAHGYRWDAKLNRNLNAPMLNDVFGFGDGGLVSTADDLNLWSEALKHGRLLSPECREQMLAPARLEGGDTAWTDGMGTVGYGLGVFLGGDPTHRIEKHSGGWGDASAQLTRFLDDDVTVVVFTNEGLWEARPWVGEQVGSFFVKGLQLPRWKSIPDPDPAFLVGVKAFVDSVVMKTPHCSGVSESFSRRVLDRIDAYSVEFSPLDLTGAQFVRTVPQGKNCLYLYRLQGPSGKVLSVERNQGGKISGIAEYPFPPCIE